MTFDLSALHSVPLLGGYNALGGGGLAHFLVRLFIWHEIWRLGRELWHIPTFGPIIVILLGVAVVALSILRSRGGLGWRGAGEAEPVPVPGRAIGKASGGGPGDRLPAGARPWLISDQPAGR
jgi:hypothetical protein